jgi:hypothetical protein
MERASFLLTDPPALVDASLSCPFCLHSVVWETAGAGTQPAIECRCSGCGHTRSVELSGAQLLRLTLADDDDAEGPVAGSTVGASWRQLFLLL